jgi:Domain of unknown function (DUF5122) beta-propeller
LRAHRLALSTVAVLGLVAGLCTAADAQTRHRSVVSENPAGTTPHLVAGDSGKQPRVLALATRRGTIYAGGIFRKVESPKRKITKHRRNVVAFDAKTGAFTRFRPKVNGAVWAVRTTRHAVYIGGDFTKVNGIPREGLAKLNPRTGKVDRSFKPPFSGGRVTDLAVVDGRLIVGGSFSRQLIALRPDTGRATGYIKVSIDGQIPDSSGRTNVFRFAVSPAGDRLVAIGNFTQVKGKHRVRAFMLQLRPSKAHLSRWWYPPLSRKCRTNAPTKLAYLQDVDFAPSGRYFVMVSTGYVIPLGAEPGRMVCDAAARFETDKLSPNKPTWINYTGGDTLHSVAVTGAAVYVQGHSRWLNNPYGADSAGPGAVDRRGGGAINPRTGAALRWNPVMPNQVGGYAFLATRHGLWIGRDGRRIGGEYHRGIAFMPLR